MTNHSEVNIRKNQSKEKVNEDKNSGMRESETLADFAARKLGIKKGKQASFS